MDQSIQRTRTTSFRSASLVRRAAPILAGPIAIPLLLPTARMVVVQPSAGQGGRWTATGRLNPARDQHTATLLPYGKVLVAAGYNGNNSIALAELYTSDEGGGLTLVSAASSKKQGNAGTFDIDLPLSGTPRILA